MELNRRGSLLQTHKDAVAPDVFILNLLSNLCKHAR